MSRALMTIASMERHLIIHALERNHGNRRKTASDLGINTSTLFRKIRSCGIDIPTFDSRKA